MCSLRIFSPQGGADFCSQHPMDRGLEGVTPEGTKVRCVAISTDYEQSIKTLQPLGTAVL